MSSKQPATRSLVDYLRYEADKPNAAALYVPAADWTKASQYPALKLPGQYTRNDYLRLAWEILRRMPRYRRQYKKLEELGIRRPTFFLGDTGAYFSDERPPSFNGWEDVPLRGHKCEPSIESQDETFGMYVEARTRAEQPWFVMNRRKWVMDFWGVLYLPNPETTFENLPKKALFSAPAAAVSLISKESPADRPQRVSTYVRQNEVLVRLRLDVPFYLQREAIRLEFVQAQRIAAQRNGSVLDPLASPGRRKAGKEVVMDYDLVKSRRPRVEAKEGRVLLKNLELSPFWLRTWDAVQTARAKQKVTIPRLDRYEIIHQLEKDSEAVLTGDVHAPELTENGRTERRAMKPLERIVKNALKPAMVPNWRARVEKYIEKSDEAFRQLVALAFETKPD
jgi:hypothetical protein